MKKNDRLIGTCVDYTAEGAGVVKVNDFCFFVKNVLKGETVEFCVTALKKNYGYGHLLRVLDPSKERREPPCPIFKQCGGCSLQHMSQTEQAELKMSRVQSCFQNIAHLDVEVQPIMRMDNPMHYRNKVQIPVGKNKNGEPVSGFYRSHSHDIVDCDNCLVQSEMQNEIHRFIRKHLRSVSFAEDMKHILIKHAFGTDEVMVVFIMKTENPIGLNEFVSVLTERFTCIKSVILNINERNDNVILGEKERLLYGKDTIQDRCGDFLFNISSKSFYQINPIQTEVLYQKAIEFAGLKGDETVLDLYCGIGTIGIFASKYAEKVVGVEIVEAAIENAKANADLNGIKNIEFYCGDAGRTAQWFAAERSKPDVIIVDPPRKGMDQVTIDAICMMAPDRLVYVSCDPATLARDCGILKQRGYRVMRVQPVDMFPMTNHVETIVLLQKETL